MKSPSDQSQRSRLPFPAVALTLLASMGLAAVVAQFVSSRNEPTLLVDPSGDRMEEIVLRLQQLEQRHAEAGTETAPVSESRRGPAVAPVSGQDPYDIDERLARLEEIEQTRQEAAQRRAEERRLQVAQISAAAAEIMMNPIAEEQMKGAAWGQLRMNAAEAWTDLIVTEAVRIGATSSNPQLRADIWRQAHAGVAHPLLLQPLLYAMANDPERSAREEAAETLDLYLDQPGVREALQATSQYDADPGVRRQAMMSLAGPQGGF